MKSRAIGDIFCETLIQDGVKTGSAHLRISLVADLESDFHIQLRESRRKSLFLQNGLHGYHSFVQYSLSITIKVQ